MTRKELALKALSYFEKSFKRGDVFRKAKELDSAIPASSFNWVFDLVLVNSGYIEEIGLDKNRGKIYNRKK